MLTEHAAAFRILMDDDLYLTKEDWFKENTFVASPAAEESAGTLPTEEINIPKFEFSGKNLKNFLILTDETLQENHLKALESTLSRKQMSLDDVAVVDLSNYRNTNFEQLNAVFMPQKLVFFGLKPETLGLPTTELNQIGTYADYQILYTYSFNEMLGNKEKTKAFWEPMKTL